MEPTVAAHGLAALAHEARLKILELLALENGDVAAGELAVRLHLSPSSLSFHLAALERAGLVRSARHGRHLLYAGRPGSLCELMGFLAETCLGGRGDVRDRLVQCLAAQPAPGEPVRPAFNVLFLCTHNAARSIMAEAILAKLGAERFRGYSAGPAPTRAPLPEVIQQLQAIGYDTTHLRSKSWNEFVGPNAPRMDFVIELCDMAQRRRRPRIAETAVTAAWPLPDPTRFKGSRTEHSALIVGLHDIIRRRLEAFVNLPFSALDRIALKARLDDLGRGIAHAK